MKNPNTQDSFDAPEEPAKPVERSELIAAVTALRKIKDRNAVVLPVLRAFSI